MANIDIPTKNVTRSSSSAQRLSADICVVGSGAAGISAALEAAGLGKNVILVDAAPVLGGQAVNAVIGTFCGLYSNGPNIHRVTYGLVDALLEDLIGAGNARYMAARNSVIVQYNEIALSRWVDKTISGAGIRVLTGAVVREVTTADRRIKTLEATSRFGDVVIEAEGFVDASGDAAVAWLAGLPVKEPVDPIYGTQVVLIEGFDEGAAASIDRWRMQDHLARKADEYGLIRKDGFVFTFPGHGIALANMTHIPTPLDPIGYSDTVFEGRDQADRLMAFLKTEYAEAYGSARVRAYPAPGIRQTRWIVGCYSLSAEDVRSGTVFDDAVARCSWPIELHNAAEGAHWEELGDNHIHTVPLRSMLHPDTDNLVAAGRCIDADTVGLSSVRVMGPCIAMGAAAAHALSLAGSGSVHQIDLNALKSAISDNLERVDAFPGF